MTATPARVADASVFAALALTPYDASYLHLAMMLGLPLATFDAALAPPRRAGSPSSDPPPVFDAPAPSPYH